jgi:hypothetical protein
MAPKPETHVKNQAGNTVRNSYENKAVRYTKPQSSFHRGPVSGKANGEFIRPPAKPSLQDTVDTVAIDQYRDSTPKVLQFRAQG